MNILLIAIGICLPVVLVGGFSLPKSGGGNGEECMTLKDIITNAVTASAVSFYADHPRGNRTYDPNMVQPFSPTGLFNHYYGKEASTVQVQGAILDLVYSALQWTQTPVDRNTLRRNLYSYIAAGSREYAREKGGELFRIIIEEYVKDSESWINKNCIEPPILYDVLEAVEVECYRIRNEVGDSKFGQFFALGVGSTLAFAIDDTGSMSGEINAAKKRAQNIVEATRGTLDAPQDFVLVAFNDPGVGPVVVTSDASEYHAALEGLYAHGGGDAPELAMRGIQLAIENSRPGSIIYVITDVDAKDIQLQDTVIAQARQKQIVVTFLLTSRISSCRDRGGYKTCYGLYEFIAQQTGGKVMVISRSDIFRATDIVQAYAKQGVVLLKEITALHNKDVAQHHVDFYVDNSIQELLLEAQGSCDNIYVTLPGQKGHATLPVQTFGDVWTVSKKISSNETNLIGKWVLGVDVIRDSCKIKIQGKSGVGFLLNVFNKGKFEPEDAYKILKSDPFVGDSVGLVLDTYGFRENPNSDVTGDHVTAIKFVSTNGKVLQTVPIEKSTSSLTHVFSDGIAEWDPFNVVIEGKDTEGNIFQRMSSRALRASHVQIDCDLSDLIIIPGQDTYAEITIHNFGPDDEFTLKVADEKYASSFNNSSQEIQVDIAKEKSVKKTLRLYVDLDLQDGTAIEVTITAKGKRRGSIQYALCTFVVGQKSKPKIDSFYIQTTINARLAETVVSSIVTNDADIGREAEFDILLPQEAFITGITIKLHNETIHGVIEEKKKAKKVYDAAKSRGTVAGHVAARDTSTRAFRTSMFVEARQDVTFILTYHQLLKRVRGKYEYSVVINPDQPIRSLTVDVRIAEENNLLFVSVPPIKTTLTNIVDETTPLGTTIDFTRPSTSAHIHYEPSELSQTKLSPKGLSGTFTVEYDVVRTEQFGQVSMDNGYFAHFFAPPKIAPTPKIVIFVVDISGSMYGNKMEQMQDALIETLQSLRDYDRFNLVMFGDKATPWFADLAQIATESVVSDAETFILESKPRGGTNVLEAFNMAIQILEPYLPKLEVTEEEEKTDEESSGIEESTTASPTELPIPVDPLPVDDPIGESSGMKPTASPETSIPVIPPIIDLDGEELILEEKESIGVMEHDLVKRETDEEPFMHKFAKMIVFLTDGRPSVGETNTKTIIDIVTEKNQGRFNLHSLGFGSLVDFKFLTKLSAKNNGTARRVFEELDADEQIKNFLEEVTNPVIHDVTIDYPVEKVEKLTTNTFSVFLGGSELVVAGQIRRDSEKEELDLDLLGEGGITASDTRNPGVFSAQIRGRSFTNEHEIFDFDVDPNKESKIKESSYRIQNFTEKLWAFLQLKDLLLQATLEDDKNKTAEINAKALNLSLEYGFVTPLTSLVVLRSKDRELIEQQLKNEADAKKKREDEEKKMREEEEKRVREESGRAGGPLWERVREESGRAGGPSMDIGFAEAFYDFPPALPTIATPPSYMHYTTTTHSYPVYADKALADYELLPLKPRKYTLARGGGRGGGGGGGGGGGFSGDPHFLIPVLPGVDVCFNWDGKEGEIYNLIYEPDEDITVNGMLVNAPAPLNSGRRQRTYVSKLSILLPNLQKKILITPFNVTVYEEGRKTITLSSKSEISLEHGPFFSIKTVEVTRNMCQLNITCQGLEFKVVMHRGHHGIHHASHLDFSMLNDLTAISKRSAGVFGQFASLTTLPGHSAKVAVIGDEEITSDGHKHVHMYIRGRFISVVQRFMKMPGTDKSTLCWFIHKNGVNVMRKKKSQFRMSSLFESPTIK